MGSYLSGTRKAAVFILSVFALSTLILSGCATQKFSAYLKEEDKFNPGVKTYYSDSIPLTEGSMFTVTNGNMKLFHEGNDILHGWYIETTYVSEHWLFVNKLMVSVDGKIFVLQSSPNAIRDVGYIFSDMVREINRFRVERDFIEAILNAKTVTTRLVGRNYHQERDLKPLELNDLKWFITYLKSISDAAKTG